MAETYGNGATTGCQKRLFEDVAELLGPSGLHAQFGFQVRNDAIFGSGFFALIFPVGMGTASTQRQPKKQENKKKNTSIKINATHMVGS